MRRQVVFAPADVPQVRGPGAPSGRGGGFSAALDRGLFRDAAAGAGPRTWRRLWSCRTSGACACWLSVTARRSDGGPTSPRCGRHRRSSPSRRRPTTPPRADGPGADASLSDRLRALAREGHSLAQALSEQAERLRAGLPGDAATLTQAIAWGKSHDALSRDVRERLESGRATAACCRWTSRRDRSRPGSGIRNRASRTGRRVASGWRRCGSGWPPRVRTDGRVEPALRCVQDHLDGLAAADAEGLQQLQRALEDPAHVLGAMIGAGPDADPDDTRVWTLPKQALDEAFGSGVRRRLARLLDRQPGQASPPPHRPQGRHRPAPPRPTGEPPRSPDAGAPAASDDGPATAAVEAQFGRSA